MIDKGNADVLPDTQPIQRLRWCFTFNVFFSVFLKYIILSYQNRRFLRRPHKNRQIILILNVVFRDSKAPSFLIKVLNIDWFLFPGMKRAVEQGNIYDFGSLIVDFNILL